MYCSILLEYKKKKKKKNIETEMLRYKTSEKTKSLGVVVDGRLNWEEQFQTVIRKVYGGLASLKKLKNTLPQSQVSNVYRALVESRMRYADVISGCLSKSRKAIPSTPSRQSHLFNQNVQNQR